VRSLKWYLLEANLGDHSPWTADLGVTGVRALVVSVHDPDQAGCWRAAENGEQQSKGAGFHAEYEHHADGDRIAVWFDGRLRAEPVRVAFAVEQD
jgi:hypothetical protein